MSYLFVATDPAYTRSGVGSIGGTAGLSTETVIPDPIYSTINVKSACLGCGTQERRTICIRRNNPIAWNAGRACALMTVPHMSRPPCHGKREKVTQLRFETVTGFGNATEPRDKNSICKDHSQSQTPGHTRGVENANGSVYVFDFRFSKILDILRLVIRAREQILECWHRSDYGGLRSLFLPD
jgi:hypothetical protein